MENLTILPGRNRQGQPEDFISIHLARGRLYTIVGNTGSGKSRLIKDVDQLAQGGFRYWTHDSVRWNPGIPLPPADAVGTDGSPSWAEYALCSGHNGKRVFAAPRPLPQPTNHTRRNSGTCKRHHTGTRIIGAKPQPAQRRTVQSPDDRGYLPYLRQPHCTD